MENNIEYTIDQVNRPKHYIDEYTDVECCSLCGWLPFHVGSAVKYIFRAGSKFGVSGGIIDIKKAIKMLELFDDSFDSDIEFIINDEALECYSSFDEEMESDIMRKRIRISKGILIKLICVDSSDDLIDNIPHIKQMCQHMISYFEFIANGGVDNEASYMGVPTDEMKDMYSRIEESHIMDISSNDSMLQ